MSVHAHNMFILYLEDIYPVLVPIVTEEKIMLNSIWTFIWQILVLNT